MRKIGKSRRIVGGFGHGPVEHHPVVGQRATVTSWPGVAHIDLDAFFARRAPADSIPASLLARDQHDADVLTISLSDGTRLSFASASRFAHAK